jgi:hypothetical protein
LVGPGTYFEHIAMESSIPIIGRDGPYQTILDGSQPPNGREGCVISSFVEGLILRVEGLTIQHGTGTSHHDLHVGGGITVGRLHSALTLKDCRIVDNHIAETEQEGKGGAIAAGLVDELVLENCYLAGNSVYSLGSILYLEDCRSTRIDGCQLELDGFHNAFQIWIEESDDCTIVGSQVESEPGADGPLVGGELNGDWLITDNTFIARGGQMGCTLAAVSVGGEVRILRNRFWTDQAVTRDLINAGGTAIVQDNAFIRVPINIGPEFNLTRNMFYQCTALIGVTGSALCNVSWPDPLHPDGGGVYLQDNVVADPLLCADSLAEFTVAETSPCIDGYSPTGCGNIGSAVIGCSITPVKRTSWGRIKNEFRR